MHVRKCHLAFRFHLPFSGLDEVGTCIAVGSEPADSYHVLHGRFLRSFCPVITPGHSGLQTPIDRQGLVCHQVGLQLPCVDPHLPGEGHCGKQSEGRVWLSLYHRS